MTRYFTMHVDNPQPRLISQAVEALRAGELIAYPTDSGYALGCALMSKSALKALRDLRGLEEKHPLTLLCHSISEVSHYSILSDFAYRIFKQYTPGAYTFILPATNQVPRLALGIKRRVVGLRIPAHPVALALVTKMGVPIISSTLWLANEESPICSPLEINPKTKGRVDLILDGGICNENPTTVVDLTDARPKIIRRGLGDPSPFED